MSNHERCQSCGSSHIIPDAFLSHLEEFSIGVTVEANPSGVFSNKPVSSRVAARVCGDCGLLVALRAADPTRLWKAYTSRKR